MEIWKTITDFPDYEVSNHGRVRRIDSGYILMPYGTGRTGWLAVKLSCDGVKRTRTVHHLVAEHFLSSSSRGHLVQHKDGDTSNNRSTNLKVDYYTGARVPA